MNHRGQTLIELIISVTLILIIITGVTILTVKGLQNSQYSRNQIQATKLAQEGIEKMRTIRDNSFTVCGWAASGNTVAPNGLWSAACPAGCRYLIQETAGTCNSTATSSLWINFTASTTAVETKNINGVNFTRYVVVTNGTDLSGSANINVKNIDLIVSWTDSSGNHSSKISTQLSKI
jgi:type II secretory pathway pseudopilin PulG